jgi:hypothetical protein
VSITTKTVTEKKCDCCGKIVSELVKEVQIPLGYYMDVVHYLNLIPRVNIHYGTNDGDICFECLEKFWPKSNNISCTFQ